MILIGMLEPALDRKPRGFSGRPAIAVLFAVAIDFFRVGHMEVVDAPK